MEEAARQERLETARTKKRKAQINHLEKKVKEGLEKLPRKEREMLEENEKKKLKLELSQAKSDLWKLRSREKKLGEHKISKELEKIHDLTEKTRKIVEILNAERARVEEEKKIENDRKEKARKEKETKELKLKKIEKLQEKWAINRWVTEYIDQNQKRWETREHERKEKIIELEKEWEKMGRLEKIKHLKRKYNNKLPEETNESEKPSEKKTWKVWRSPEKKIVEDEKTQQNTNTTNNTTAKEIPENNNEPKVVPTIQPPKLKPEVVKNTNDYKKPEFEEKHTSEKNPEKQEKQQDVVLPYENKQQEAIEEKKPTIMKNNSGNNEKKKQTTIMNFINSPGAKLLRTTTPKKQQPGSPGLGKKMKTTSIKKPPKKTTKGIEQKTVKQLQSFWKDFAEKQRIRSQEIPARGCDVVANNQVLTSSEISNAGKPPELAKPTEDEVFLPLNDESNDNSASSVKPATNLELSNHNLLILKSRESKD